MSDAPERVKLSKEEKDRRFQAELLPVLDPLYNFAYRLTLDEDDANDLVQETYLKAYRFFEYFEPGTNAKAWLFRILKNSFINDFRKKANWVAAICAATTALVAAHKRDDGTGEVKTTVTSHPSVKDEVVQAGWQYSEDRVVVDQRVITSRGPGTAILFALTIVEELCGKEKRDEVAGPMIVAETL